MSETKLINYFAIMLGINVILGLAQIGINSYDPTVTPYTTTDTPLATLTYGGNLSKGLDEGKLDAGVTWDTADSVEETGGIFTDSFKTVKAWVNKIDTTFGILGAIITQPYGFLKQIGTPPEIATAFGIIWYIILILLIVSFIKGGDPN